jgi:hypothetical protein
VDAHVRQYALLELIVHLSTPVWCLDASRSGARLQRGHGARDVGSS